MWRLFNLLVYHVASFQPSVSAPLYFYLVISDESKYISKTHILPVNQCSRVGYQHRFSIVSHALTNLALNSFFLSLSSSYFFLLFSSLPFKYCQPQFPQFSQLLHRHHLVVFTVPWPRPGGLHYAPQLYRRRTGSWNR